MRSGALDSFYYSVPGSYMYIASQNTKRFTESEVGLGVEFIYLFFNYILIFAVFIPISLLVTIDMAKFLQMYTIQWDRAMYYDVNSVPCQVRAPDLNESLGMVNHVFSDKTGTLTCNIMEFRKCSIAGKSYGKGTTQIGRGRLRRENKPIPPEPKNTGRVTPFVNFIDSSLDVLMANDDKTAHAFMLNMALNHEVTPELIDGTLDYGGPSPDEIAFVWFAKHMGYTLVDKPSRTSLTITRPNGKQETWEVLDILQFTSTRKRSSVIVRQIGADGKVWKNMTDQEKADAGNLRMFSKGADNVMMKMLRSDLTATDPLYQQTVEHTTDFSKDGLRILVIAEKEVEFTYYDAWSKKYAKAKVAEVDRDQLMEVVMGEIEVELDLVGVTAIEDKLQNGVPEAISAMRAGGVKVWVLTGDKVDTAINIGYACEVMTDKMKVIELNCKNAEVKALLDLDLNGFPTSKCLVKKLDEALAIVKQAGQESNECVVVIDTYFLSSIVNNKQGDTFLALARNCKSVVAARVSPDQKGEIVRMVRAEALKKDTYNDALVTLAIGDGANDVTMIKEAHIGVGIDGLEGKQAVNSSDYAIGQFKYLHRLMFVHGRWNYRRMSILILYMFYKNCLLVLPQWLLGMYSLFSGQNFYVEYPLYQLSNIAFTAFPIIFFAIFDQDVVAEIPLQVPELYKDGNTFSIHFSVPIFWKWMAEGTWSAVVCFFFGMWALARSPTSGNPALPNEAGKVSDIWYIGTCVHLSVTTIQNIRLMLEVRHFNWLTTGSFIFSMAAWFVLVVFFAYVPALSFAMSSSEAIGLDQQMFGDATAWLTIILSIVVSLLPAYLFKIYDNVYAPKLNQIALELQNKHYSEIRPEEEYWFACLCCGKGAYANVPVDGEEPLVKPPTNTAGTGLELTSIGQKNEDGKDYENPMAIDTSTGNLTCSLPLDFQKLRKHLNAKQ
jgi:phospholipid-translocating P-type ATPase (flippase)